MSNMTNAKYNDCPKLFEAKANADLSSIKYYAFRCNINYLNFIYSTSSYSSALERAERLGDLKGSKFILTQFNKLYPDDLYVSTKEKNLKKAINLFDLEGIKIICKAENYSNHLLIYDFIDLTTNEDKIFFAIDTEDLEGVKYIIAQNHLSSDELVESVRYAYYKENLDIAIYLVTYTLNKDGITNNLELLQAIFSGILRSRPSVSYEIYNKHIFYLQENIIDFPVQVIKSLTSAMFNVKNNKTKLFSSNDIIYSDVSADINIADYIGLDSFIGKNYHFIIQDIISFFSISNTENLKIEIFFPIYNTAYISPFYSPFKIDDTFKNHRIYMPITWDNVIVKLIHEIAHVFCYVLLENSGLPYTEMHASMSEDYEIALNKTLTNLATNFTNNKYHSFEEPGLVILLRLNSWHLTLDKDKNLTTKLLNKLFGENTKFNDTDSILILETKYQEIYEEFNWTPKHQYVLERILGYYQRNGDVKNQEFIAIASELHAAILSNDIIANFYPIANYWKQYYSPIVQKIKANHFKYCIKQLTEQKKLTDCMLHALTAEQANKIWLLSVEQKCNQCFEQIYTNPYLVESISTDQRKEILSYAANKISHCTEYCDDPQNCVPIPQYGWFNGALSFTVKNIFGCTKIYNNTEGTEWIQIVQTIIQNDNLLYQND